MIAPEEAKQHLRVLHDHEDSIIKVYTNAAVSRFQQFTGRKLYESQSALEADSEAPVYTVVMNDEIKAGCLLLLAHLYVNRNEDADMPRAISYLWQSYWVPMIS